MRKKPTLDQLRKKGIDPFKTDKRMTRQEYDAYMKSPAWRKLRKRVFKLQGYVCRKCGVKERLTLHHKTYVRLGREKPKDMEVLCFECHMERHDDVVFAKEPVVQPSTISRDTFWIWNPVTQSYQLREEYRRDSTN